MAGVLDLRIIIIIATSMVYICLFILFLLSFRISLVMLFVEVYCYQFLSVSLLLFSMGIL